jgi:hypothetical protein
VTTRYIGIDCGLDGAIVTIEGERILEMMSMPTKKVGAKREIDIDVLAKLFDSQFKRDFCFASVEDPGGHAPSAAGLRSMTYSFAIIKALLVSNKIKFKTMSARTWQKQFFSKPKGMKEKFDTKAAALEAANEIWANTNWRRTPRSRIPFDGFVDAVLIAEYARRMQG